VASSIIKDKKWEHLPAPFKEVKLDRMDGRNLLSKVFGYFTPLNKNKYKEDTLFTF
jgi:hypothetical protein